MREKMKLVGFLVCTLTALGCTATPVSQLDQKVGQETPIADRAQLEAQAGVLIQNDQNLTPIQRDQFLTLKASVDKELNDISEQSWKLRSVLVKELLSSNYSADDVSQIKSRLRKLEDERLSVMFDGVDKANSILGRNANDHQAALRALMEERADRESPAGAAE